MQAVSSPLGFFVLALLIVETFLATVLVGAGLDRADKVLGMWIGVGLFFLVTLAVFVLVWSKPENLTFDKDAHLVRGKAAYGNEGKAVADRERLPPPTASEPTQQPAVGSGNAPEAKA